MKYIKFAVFMILVVASVCCAANYGGGGNKYFAETLVETHKFLAEFDMSPANPPLKNTLKNGGRKGRRGSGLRTGAA